MAESFFSMSCRSAPESGGSDHLKLLSSLARALVRKDFVEQLRAAYREWPIFGTLIDVAEMSLAKTNRHLMQEFLSLGQRDDMTLGYWSDTTLSYAVVAKTSDAQIAAIASEITEANRNGRTAGGPAPVD